MTNEYKYVECKVQPWKKHNFDLYKINTNLTFSQITVHLYAFWIQKLKNKLYIYYNSSIRYFSWILYVYM